MDHDDQIKALRTETNALSAETLALQYILANLMYQVRKVSPELGSAIELALNDAASGVENLAISLGKTASPQYSVKAIRVVEELRATALGNEKKPRHGV
jgi:hypothetical protein